MRPIVPLLTISCPSLPAQQSVNRVTFSESKHAIRAFLASGEVTIPAVSLQLDISHESGKSERSNLVVVYDPQNGYYFWRNTPASGPGDTAGFLSALQSGLVAVYVETSAIVDFYMTGQLYFQEHRGRASTLDSAEDGAIDDIRRHLATYERNGYDSGVKGVAIGQAIEEGFACPTFPPSAICASVTKITSVSRQGDIWRLVIQNRWDQEVILDSNFKFVSTKRLSDPVNDKRQ